MINPSSILRGLALSGALLALPACARSGANHAAHAQPATRSPSKGEAATGADKIHAERIAVSFGDVHKLANVLRDVLDVEGPRQGPVRAILVDEPTGDLVILGTDEGIAAAKRIISPACEARPEGTAEVEVVPLTHAAAADVVHAIRPTASAGTKVIADAPTNSVIIQAAQDERARLRRTIAALDGAPIPQ